MKKYILTVLLVLSITASFTACGSSSSTTSQSITTESSSVSSAVEEPTESEEANTENGSSVESTEGASEASSEETIIEQQILLDENDVVITATGYEEDSIWGDGINLLIENNGSIDIGVQCNAVIVNDWMITNLFSETVAAGKKSNGTLNLMSSELEAAGITNIGQIEIYFYFYDPDTFETISEAEPVVIKTNKYDSMDTEPNDDGTELYNDGNYRIVGKYVDEDSVWGNAIVLYLENNTEQNVIFQCDDLSINGFMITPFFSSTVYANKKAIDDITLMQSELDDNNIESVDDIELKFQIIEEDSYGTILETDPIQFSVN